MATIYGTSNNDQLTGTSSSDSIYAYAGNDELRGLGGNDYLVGYGENDLLVGGAGADTLYGETGDDRYIFEAGFGQDYIGDYYGLNTIEFTDSQEDEVTMSNSSGSLVISVEGTSDTLTIGSYYSYVDNFTFEFAEPDEPVETGPTAGDDVLTGTDGADTIDALAGNDEIAGLAGDDSLVGNTGDDLINGDDGNDTIGGGFGLDTIYGGNGNDRLFPQEDADTVYGGSGDDLVGGGSGRDVRTGGQGRDTFSFGASELGTRDLITDFAKGSDKLDLKSVDANTARSNDQAFKFVGTAVPDDAGEVGYRKSGGSTYVRGNTDNDATIEFEIQLSGSVTLAGGDFIL